MLLFWVVSLSGIGLYAFARERMSPRIAAIVLAHCVGGLLLIPVAAVVRRSLPPLLRHRASGAVAIVCAASGMAMLALAAARVSVGHASWLMPLHVAAGVLVSAAALVAAAVRWRRWTLAGLRPVAAAGALLLGPAALASYSYDAEQYYRTLTATNAAQADNPAFPSGAHYAGAAASEQACDSARCHPAEHEGYAASVHASAASNTTYFAAYRALSPIPGQGQARWCAGCHAPIQSREFPVTVAGLGGGVACTACHGMASVSQPTGNGRAAYSAPQAYPYSGALHDFLVYLRPAPHRASLAGPHDARAGVEMCVPCHRASATIAQNGYRFLRYDDTWKEWQSGPWSGDSLHTLAAAPKQTCTGCHMAPAPGTPEGHRCAAMRHSPGGNLSVNFAVLRRSGASPSRQLLIPLIDGQPTLKEGEVVGVDVLIRNLRIGHAFPTGAPDLRETWLNVEARDASGRLRLKAAESDVHRYGLLALDREARAVHDGHPARMAAVVYRNQIDSGGADLVRLRFAVPGNTGGRLTLTARLLFRRVRGQGAPITLAQDERALPVADHRGAVSAAESLPPSVQESAALYEALGGALLRQRDLGAARQSLQRAISLSPQRPDSLIALGRVYLEEGDLLAARTQLEAAEKLPGGSARARAWLGRVYRLMGQYEESLRILRPLTQSNSADSELWFDYGRSLYQLGRYEQAADAFVRMLDIDPDDASAHLNLMLSYRSLRRVSLARVEEAAYRALQSDEPQAALVEPYLAAHPEDAREARPIHVHTLRSLP